MFSLVFKSQQWFSKSYVSVLLLKDVPPLGFEGQIVKVKPGHATSHLIPKSIALINTPGIKNRIFPNLKEENLREKQVLFNQTAEFLTKINNLTVDFIKLASFTNPEYLKDGLKERDVIMEVKNKYGIEIELNTFQMDKDILKFGFYKVPVVNHFEKKLNKNFDFAVKVSVKKQEELAKKKEKENELEKTKEKPKENKAEAPKEKESGKEKEGSKEKGGKEKKEKGQKDK